MVDNTLFTEGLLSEVLRAQVVTMRRAIDGYDANKLLNTNPDELADYFAAKYRLEPPQIVEGGIEADQSETRVDARHSFDRDIRPELGDDPYVPGTLVTVNVRFTGDPDLLKFEPSQRYMGGHALRGKVVGDTVILSHSTADQNPTALRQWYDDQLRQLRQYFEWVSEDVNRFNDGLGATAHQRIAERRSRLLASQSLAASLGIPLVQRPDAPRTYAVPDLKRKPTPQPPAASAAPFQPEPALTDEQYEQILSLIRPMASTMERDPAAFAELSEENLRSFFLAALNSHYQGRATGETFNVGGKTDILIREGDRNVFIAECKIWRGEKTLSEAIDQILSYASWRDTKTAIVLFNRNKNLSAVLEKIPGIVAKHECYKGTVGKRSETEFRFRFRHRDDPNRELALTVLVFEVPA